MSSTDRVPERSASCRAPSHGVDASALLRHVVGAWGAESVAARASGCTSAWLTTTNDDLDALRSFQRRGFRLRVLRRCAVDRARRTLEPAIPVTGMYGVGMRDELDLEIDLR